MPNIHIKCYNAATSAAPAHAFFMLNRGSNSGRPERQPRPNCFVVWGDTPYDSALLFKLVFLLFHAERFKKHLIGSVVLLLRIGDAREVIQAGLNKVPESDILILFSTISPLMQFYQALQNALDNQIKVLKIVSTLKF